MKEILKEDQKFSEFMEIVLKWSEQGERLTNSGARLICPTPHVAPEAWLHALFQGLSDQEISEMEKKVNVKFPSDFRFYLTKCNGAKLFSYAINVWGYRETFERKGDAVWQPYRLVSLNEASEKPRGAPPGILFFGNYEEGERVYFDTRNGIDSSRVYLTSDSKFKPVRDWPDFWTWLLEETKRMTLLFDDTGRPVKK